ncbi:hypothetical protein [Edaphobacter bradus]|uniref:hypothetical protein n=1 Tax=Edaphobacter bradus TaxID=2259016 RepID=UPI0021E04879|nr:hypothetical protein [Edaphobacter bradus]
MNEQFFPRMLRSARCGTVLLSLASISLPSQPCRAQVSASHPVSDTQDAIPEPAIPAILKTFETFEVVGMPAAHGQKDIDDFILSLIRDPRFPASVNDIVVECGNVRYQPVLDRYIAGEDVPFTEVQHVWRDTTVQQMCGASGFYEQLFPLVRSLNQRLPARSRLRVVAADPPIDWGKIYTHEDLTSFFGRDENLASVREGSIASVMEREVLSKHRKALMLFGVFHLVHGGGPGEGDAVTRYERHYPGRTFVISDFGYYGTGNEPLGEMNAPGGVWPSLLRTKNSSLGTLGLDSFLPSPITTDQNCNAIDAFSSKPSKTVADQIDAFLYLGPQKLLLAEPLPADIALDRAYRSEWLRRMKVAGLPVPSTLEELDVQIVASAAHPVLTPAPRQPVSQETKLRIRQDCLSRKHPTANTAK